MSRYVRVDRGSGSRAGQLLQHVSDPKRWQVKAFIGRDGKGKKLYRSEVVHGRKRDAEARLIELLQDRNTGKLTPRSTATLADLVKEWTTHKAREVTPRTLAGYQATLDLYVLPSLGHRKLADINLREIDRLYAHMLDGKLPKPENAKYWTGKPLSARTVRLAHAALSQALRQAVRWQMLPFNPAAEATLPTGRSKEKTALTAAERARFIAACETTFYKTFYRLLLDTGLRPGEACALTWGDIDFEAQRLTVSKATTKGKDGEGVTGEPKTVKSRRTIPLFGLTDLLLEHRNWQAAHGLDRAGRVFTNQEGRPLAPWTFSRRELERTLKAAGITGDFPLYSFRHTFATLHLASGTPLKVVSSWLGHSTIQQTANTYMHVSTDVSEDWAAKHVAFLEAAAQSELRPVN